MFRTVYFWEMASQELPPQQPSDALHLEKRDDEIDPSTTTSTRHEPDGNVNGKQGVETNVASGMPPSSTQNQEPEWAHGFQLFTILAAVTFVSFLMLLDGTIVVAAVPRITDDFNSLNDIGWYGAAYQLGRYVNTSSEYNVWTLNWHACSAVFQPLTGKIYMKFKPKVSQFSAPHLAPLSWFSAHWLSNWVDISELLRLLWTRFLNLWGCKLLWYVDRRTSNCRLGNFGNLEWCHAYYRGMRPYAEETKYDLMLSWIGAVE